MLIDEPTGEGIKADRTNRFCSEERKEEEKEKTGYLQTADKQQKELGRPSHIISHYK